MVEDYAARRGEVVFPEAGRTAVLALTLGSMTAGVALVAGGFWAAEKFADVAARLGRRLTLAFAPSCPDCSGKGWRRRKEGDGTPFAGWTNCRLCRGLGKIVDEDDRKGVR